MAKSKYKNIFLVGVDFTSYSEEALAYAGDDISSAVRLTMCSSAKSMDIPLTDWFCELEDIKGWLRDYQVGKLQYQHQRCPRWEERVLS